MCFNLFNDIIFAKKIDLIKIRRTKTERYKNPRVWSDFNSFIRRNRRRFLIRQKPKIIWFTGLSGSGKTTLVDALNKVILSKGYFTKVFDGDVIRTGLNRDLGFDMEDRTENIRRIAEVGRMFLDSGLIVLCGFITPTKEMRELAREIVGPDRFVEVHVNCPIEICELRDVKGLYKKAREGKLKNFTGIDSPYEAPENPDIVVNTVEMTPDEAAEYIVRSILPLK